MLLRQCCRRMIFEMKIGATEHSAKSWFLARYFSIRGVEGVVDFRPTIVISQNYIGQKIKLMPKLFLLGCQ